MAAEASEIQGHVSVAINRIRGAPREPFILYIEELADRRCFSIETGFVELLVRLVALTEKGHDCVTGPSLFKKTVANSLPCGRVL